MPDASPDMDSLYGATDEGGDTEHKGAPDSIDQEEQEDMSQQAEVPVSVLQSDPSMEIKPGDEIVVQVVSVKGDSALIKYAPKKEGKGEGEGEDEEAGEKTPDQEIDELDKSY